MPGLRFVILGVLAASSVSHGAWAVARRIDDGGTRLAGSSAEDSLAEAVDALLAGCRESAAGIGAQSEAVQRAREAAEAAGESVHDALERHEQALRAAIVTKSEVAHVLDAFLAITEHRHQTLDQAGVAMGRLAAMTEELKAAIDAPLDPDVGPMIDAVSALFLQSADIIALAESTRPTLAARLDQAHSLVDAVHALGAAASAAVVDAEDGLSRLAGARSGSAAAVGAASALLGSLRAEESALHDLAARHPSRRTWSAAAEAAALLRGSESLSVAARDSDAATAALQEALANDPRIGRFGGVDEIRAWASAARRHMDAGFGASESRLAQVTEEFAARIIAFMDVVVPVAHDVAGSMAPLADEAIAEFGGLQSVHAAVVWCEDSLLGAASAAADADESREEAWLSLGSADTAAESASTAHEEAIAALDAGDLLRARQLALQAVAHAGAAERAAASAEHRAAEARGASDRATLHANDFAQALAFLSVLAGTAEGLVLLAEQSRGAVLEPLSTAEATEAFVEQVDGIVQPLAGRAGLDVAELYAALAAAAAAEAASVQATLSAAGVTAVAVDERIADILRAAPIAYAGTPDVDRQRAEHAAHEASVAALRARASADEARVSADAALAAVKSAGG
jgi:hypothetical protein